MMLLFFEIELACIELNRQSISSTLDFTWQFSPKHGTSSIFEHIRVNGSEERAFFFFFFASMIIFLKHARYAKVHRTKVF